MQRHTEFLISAIRRFLDPKFSLPDFQDIDWLELLRLADAHAVTPMLYHALRDEGIATNVSEELRSGFQISVAWSLAQAGELARVVGLLKGEGIEAIALKGPLLSQYLYGDVGSRSSGDIDLLVKRESVIKTRDVLVSNRYRLTTKLHWESDSACLRSRENEISFVSPSNVSIDVHWRLVPSYFASAFDEMDVWEASRTEKVAGREIRTLAPEPLLLFLCAHGAKHTFERLGWICDIARFLIVSREMDWDAVARYANRQLSVGVWLAVNLLGAPAPAVVAKDAVVEKLISIVRTRLLAGNIPPVPPLESNRFCLRLLESSGQRFRYLSGQYITPSEAEYMALRLPPWLFPLYYPYRPLRLLAKHVLRSSWKN